MGPKCRSVKMLKSLAYRPGAFAHTFTGELGDSAGTERPTHTAQVTQTFRLKLLSYALVGPLVACAADNVSTPQAPAALTIVSGNDQVDSIGAILAESLVVRVTSASGAGLDMVPIAWRAEAGFVYPETTATDPSGVARSRWTLGVYPGRARVVVLVAGMAITDTFTATVRAGRGVRILLVRQGPAWIIPSDSLGILASVNDRLGNPVASTAIQWSSSDPLVATVSDAGPGHPPVPPGQVQVVIHAVAAGRANVAGRSGDARDSVGVTVVRDTAVYGGYDLERRDTVAYPYCQYPAAYEVDCFSGSLTLDGVGGFVAKTFFIVTLIPMNQTLIDSGVTTGTYQALSTCELQLAASGEPTGRALKSGALLSVTTDSTASAQHVWVYHGGARPQAYP